MLKPLEIVENLKFKGLRFRRKEFSTDYILLIKVVDTFIMKKSDRYCLN